MFNKKLKQENSRLTQELLDIKQELEKCKMQLVVEEDNFDKSQQIISELKKECVDKRNKIYDLELKLKQTDFDELNNQLKTKNSELISINNEISTKSIELNQLKTDLVCLNDKIYIQQLGLYEPPNDIQYYKDELNSIRKQESQILIDNKYFSFLQQWVVNGNTRQGELFGKFLARVCITSFNLNFDAIVDKLTVANINNIKNRLEKIYGNYNQTLRENGLMLSMDYYNLKMKELDIRLNIVIKKQQDKEDERLRKEQLKEELLVEKQLNQEKERLEKELLKLQNKQLNMQVNGQVDDMLNKTIDDIKEKLNINEYRRENTRAGYCYIVSSPSFGKDVYKIGISRRTDMCEGRLKELSGSNVPFVFKPHCIIWSDDCFKLESDLHKDFSAYRVNKLKVHREFFKVPLEQIEKVLNEKYNIYEPFDYSIIDEDFIASNYEIGENFIEKENNYDN